MITLENVSEKYRIKFVTDNRVRWEEVWALRDVTLTVGKGESVGIIGHNGAGKTTLLKLISGLLVPDIGRVDVQGRVSSLMELGAGFNPEFTGRENISLNARTYGFSDDILREKMREIIEFAALDKFIDAPVKFYSQGMYMRLAFALSIFVEPDILLIDDIISVGDEETHAKCVKRVFEMKKSGTTIIAVSHDLSFLARLCDRMVLFEKGRVKAAGEGSKIIPFYRETIGEKKGIAACDASGTRIVFNNGKLTLSHQGTMITGENGIQAVSFNRGTGLWNSSAELVWDSGAAPAEDPVRACGSFPDGSGAQEWAVRIQEDSVLVTANFPDDPKDKHFDFFLKSGFTGYALFDGTRAFPPFVHKTAWQDIGQGKYFSESIGLVPTDDSGLPYLVIDLPDKESNYKLFNTGYDLECHLLQLFSNGGSLSFLLRIFPDKIEFEKYFGRIKERFQREMKAREEAEKEKREEEEARLRSERTITSGPVKIFADERDKMVRLYYNDVEVTAGLGVHACFARKKQWQEISTACWQVNRHGTKLVLDFSWPGDDRICLAVTCADAGVSWEIQTDFSSPVDSLKYGIAVTEGYRKYFCGREAGTFPERFTQWEDLALADPGAVLFGIRKQDVLPAVTCTNNGGRCIIQNSDEISSCRALQVSIPGKDIAGGKLSLQGSIVLTEDERAIEDSIKQEQERFQRELKAREDAEKAKRADEENRLRTERTITSGPVKIYADEQNKLVRLYYNDEEVTEGLGVHACFVRKNQRQDTSSARWQVRREGTGLVLDFSWPGDDRICLAVTCADAGVRWEMQAEFSSPVDSLKYGIAVTAGYGRYFCGREEGAFPGSFRRWEDLELTNPAAELFGVRTRNGLPAVTCTNNGGRCIIQNSDEISSCRILQVCIQGKDIPGGKLSLQWNIGLTEDERAIDDFIKQEQERFQRELKAREDAEKAKREDEENRLRSERTITSGMVKIYADDQDKAIHLYYNDVEVTEGIGVHVCFARQNQWQDTSSARWQVSQEDQTLFIDFLWAESDRVCLALTCVDAGVRWDVLTEFSVPVDLLKCGMVVKAGYGRYFCGREEKMFPGSFTQWEDLTLADPGAGLFGVRKQDALPAITFTNKEGRCIIQNGDEISSCRALQVCVPGKDVSGGKLSLQGGIDLAEDERAIDDFIKREQERFEQERQALADRLRSERTITYGPVKIYADDQDKAIRLYYKDVEVTEGIGVHVCFARKNKWRELLSARWQVSRKGQTLFLDFSWPGEDRVCLAVTCNESGVGWEARTEFTAPVDTLKYGIAVKAGYERYFCGWEEGAFPESFTQWEDLALSDPVAGLFGVRKQDALPAITFTNKEGRCIIQNSDKNSSCRTVQVCIAGQDIIGGKSSAQGIIGLAEDERAINDFIKREQERFGQERQALADRLRSERTITYGPVKIYADDQDKAIRLYYKDVEVTGGFGVHACFARKNQWQDTLTARWQVSRKGQTLFLDFSWPGEDRVCLAVTCNESGVGWEARTEFTAPVDTLKYGIAVKAGYERYFCGWEEGAFPESFTQWEDLALSDPVAGLFGVRKQDALPAITFTNKEGRCIIQNSDKNSSCRTVQVCIAGKDIIGGKSSAQGIIGLTEDEREIDGFISRELDAKENATSIISGNTRLFIDMERKKIRLYYGAEEITAGIGVRVADPLVENGRWQCMKTAENAITLRMEDNPDAHGTGRELSFVMDDPSSISVEAAALVSTPQPLASILRFELNACYKAWSTELERGDFSGEPINGVVPIRFKCNKVSRVTVTDGVSGFPPVSIESFDNRKQMIMSLTKDQRWGLICVNSERIFSYKDRVKGDGRHVYFKGKIRFGEVPCQSPEPVGSLPCIENGGLKFRFDEGRGRIFWRDREITSGLNLYTSVRVAGFWYDSGHAYWNVESSSEKEVVCFGDWPTIPIGQRWTLTRGLGGEICWTVRMHIYEPLTLDIEQANLMLTCAYTQWMCDGHNGEYSDWFTPGYDILPFRFWSGKSEREELCAQGKHTPGVFFRCATENMIAVVENSDAFFHSRLLQYQRAGRVLQPGEYTYFKGTVKLQE